MSSDKNAQQKFQIIELDRLNRLLGDELRWYEGQEAMWRAFDMKNQNRLRQLNEEILSVLHLYGELDQERDRNTALREQNARLQYEVDKLRLDAKACARREKGLNCKCLILSAFHF